MCKSKIRIIPKTASPTQFTMEKLPRAVLFPSFVLFVWHLTSAYKYHKYHKTSKKKLTPNYNCRRGFPTGVTENSVSSARVDV